MKKVVEAVLKNMTSDNVFKFRVSCTGCGSEYGNRPRRFSKTGVVPTTQNGKVVLDALYEYELETARQAAIRVAAEHMNYCPLCKQLVCDQCFVICCDIDMCKRCAAELEQQGNPVHTGVSEATT